jgi:hypothetical protein
MNINTNFQNINFIKVCTKCNNKKTITEFYKQKRGKHGIRSVCISCSKQYDFEHKEEINLRKKSQYFKNKSEINLKHKQYYIDNKNKIETQHVIYVKQRKEIDIDFKTIINLRSRLNQALKGNWKSGHTIELLMCSIHELKLHIESLWLPGMSWNNYGFGNNKWNIDHIIPCSFFNMLDPTEQHMCFRWKNLQPMWQIDNFKKGDKLIGLNI